MLSLTFSKGARPPALSHLRSASSCGRPSADAQPTRPLASAVCSPPAATVGRQQSLRSPTPPALRRLCSSSSCGRPSATAPPSKPARPLSSVLLQQPRPAVSHRTTYLRFCNLEFTIPA